MNIHPLWYVCLTVRISLILIYAYISKKGSSMVKNLTCLLLFIIGSGFLYKSITGSNEEKQISKVFWHETRFIHAIFYLLASLYLYNRNTILLILILSLDVIFSLLYRIISKK